MDKKEALAIIYRCADMYRQNLCNRMLLIISINSSKNKASAVELTFEKTNFMHLTGVKPAEGARLSPRSFYDMCLRRRLRAEDFELAPDGTTELKLAVLPEIVSHAALSANMIGDYYSRRPALITDKLAGNVRGCIGMVYDSGRGCYFPNTILKLDMRTAVQNRQRIIAVYRKAKTDDRYTELVYRAAKDIDLSTIAFPDPYGYLSAE